MCATDVRMPPTEINERCMASNKNRNFIYTQNCIHRFFQLPYYVIILKRSGMCLNGIVCAETSFRNSAMPVDDVKYRAIMEMLRGGTLYTCTWTQKPLELDYKNLYSICSLLNTFCLNTRGSRWPYSIQPVAIWRFHNGTLLNFVFLYCIEDTKFWSGNP